MSISVTVTITGDSALELSKELAGITTALEMIAKDGLPPVAASAPKKKSPLEGLVDKKDKDTKAEPEEEVAHGVDLGFGDEKEAEAKAEAAPKGPTLDDVIAGFQAYAKKHSREKAAKVLAKYHTKSVRDLHENKYAEVLKLLKA